MSGFIVRQVAVRGAGVIGHSDLAAFVEPANDEGHLARLGIGSCQLLVPSPHAGPFA